MKLIKFILVAAFLQYGFAYSQHSKEIEDIIKLKKKNLKLQKRILSETGKSKEFLALALDNTQSAKTILGKISAGSETEDSDRDMAAMLSEKARLYSSRSDSVAKIIEVLQDSVKVNVAAIYNIASKMKISNPDSILNSGMNSGPASVRADEGRAPGTVKTVETQQEQAPQTIMQEPLKKDGKVYTVQIKADRKRGDLIKGMENLKVVKGDDGYFRYFVGEYSSIEDAKRAQKRLADEGYRDCFVKVLK